MNQQHNEPGFTLAQIVQLYPLLYSRKCLDDWFNLFDKRATMVILKNGHPRLCQLMIDGMPEQCEYAAENEIFVEEWHDVEIHQYGNIAMVKADYVLTADHEIRKGVDLLTLCCDERGWLITNLTFEQKECLSITEAGDQNENFSTRDSRSARRCLLQDSGGME